SRNAADMNSGLFTISPSLRASSSFLPEASSVFSPVSPSLAMSAHSRRYEEGAERAFERHRVFCGPAADRFANHREHQRERQQANADLQGKRDAEDVELRRGSAQH